MSIIQHDTTRPSRINDLLSDWWGRYCQVGHAHEKQAISRLRDAVADNYLFDLCTGEATELDSYRRALGAAYVALPPLEDAFRMSKLKWELSSLRRERKELSHKEAIRELLRIMIGFFGALHEDKEGRVFVPDWIRHLAPEHMIGERMGTRFIQQLGAA